jgi:tRNA modification GTPase
VTGRGAIGALLADDDVIVAVATPAGRGAVGIVRLSGPGPAVQAVVEPMVGALPPARRASLRSCRGLEGAVLDRVLVLYLPGPGSLTGEDVVELQAHGAPVVLEEIVGAAVTLGARPARPGEFLRRAFQHGRVDLLEAEATDALIRAEGALGARLARRHLGGALDERISGVRERLLAVAAAVEAALDFPEDVEHERVAELVADLGPVRDSLQALAGSVAAGRVRVEGAHVVLSGPVNAGKSTLFNTLLGEDRAIVHERPGTTRDVLREAACWEGLRVWLHDTAGEREAEDVIEREGVARGRRARAGADLVLWVQDGRGLPIGGSGPRWPEGGVRVITHRDELDAAVVMEWERWGAIVVDARAERSVAAVRSGVVGALSRSGSTDGLLLHTERQGRIVAAAVEALDMALSLPSSELALRAQALRQAGEALEELAGRWSSDEVLDALFGRFCLGK